jgi:hypothetical protein
MKILRRGLIVLLIAANIVLLVYVLNGIKEPPQEINAENVTVVAAPDQTEAQIHPDFVKKEFVLELPEGTNIAVDKKIDANAFNDVYAANRANNGSADAASYWEGTSEYPNLLTIDLEAPAKIHTVRVALNPQTIWSKRTQTIAVNISSDGEAFTELVATKQYTFDPDEGNQIQIAFDEVETRFVQLVITENSGAVGGQVAEFEIYSK